MAAPPRLDGRVATDCVSAQLCVGRSNLNYKLPHNLLCLQLAALYSSLFREEALLERRHKVRRD